jgi:hypothetical protein
MYITSDVRRHEGGSLRGWPTGEIRLIGEAPTRVWSQSGKQEKGSKSKF